MPIIKKKKKKNMNFRGKLSGSFRGKLFVQVTKEQKFPEASEGLSYKDGREREF